MIKRNLLLLIFILSVNTIFAQFNYDAVIVGENVRLRSSSDLKGKVINTLKTGAVVKILQQTKVREIIKLGLDMCDDYGYYWYEVETPSKQTGWIFGAFIYSIDNDSEPDEGSVYYKAYDIDGQMFYLDLARSNTYGTADEQGLTGCDEPSIIFFYKKNESKIYPIQIIFKESNSSKDLMTSKDKNWLLMYAGEGGSDHVSEIKSENNEYFMIISRGFQDGGAEVKLKLTFKGTYFEAKEVYYKQFPSY